jgi:hypothetical protein
LLVDQFFAVAGKPQWPALRGAFGRSIMMITIIVVIEIEITAATTMVTI